MATLSSKAFIALPCCPKSNHSLLENRCNTKANFRSGDILGSDLHLRLTTAGSRKIQSFVAKKSKLSSTGVVHASSEFPSTSSSNDDNIILEVKGLKAVIAESGTEILRGVDLVIREGEIHAIMGKNGSGKSTLTKVLVGHPDYEVTEGTAIYKGKNLFELEPEERSHAGLFLSFQSPVEVPGVNNVDFLRLACNSRRAALGIPELDPLEFYGYLSPKLDKLKMDPTYLQRNVNEGFSGGEKKRNEILQLAVLEADLAILDEIDSGLDIDALRDVSEAVNGLKTPQNAILMITHYQRLLDYISPQFVHIMEKGRIVMTGDIALAKELEAGGYAAVRG